MSAQENVTFQITHDEGWFSKLQGEEKAPKEEQGKLQMSEGNTVGMFVYAVPSDLPWLLCGH